MPFEIGDRVVLSEVGFQGNTVGRNEEGEIVKYEGDVSYPWRVEWDCGDGEVYSTRELENLDGTKVAPKTKQSGFAKFMNQIESGGVPCEV